MKSSYFYQVESQSDEWFVCNDRCSNDLNSWMHNLKSSDAWIDI